MTSATDPTGVKSKRIGLLVPSSNTTVEVEFYRALPPEITLHVARLYLTRIEPDSIARVAEDLDRGVEMLASADVDVIVLGATAPSLLNGKGYDRELIKRIRAKSGKQATTTATAVLAALEALGLSRIALGTAFKKEVNDIAIRFLNDNGIKVVSQDGLGLVDNLTVGRLPPDSAVELARRIDVPEAETLLLACTNWRSIEILDRLEADLGKPVLSTSQVTLWHALHLIGHDEPIAGAGQLLKSLAPASKQAA